RITGHGAQSTRPAFGDDAAVAGGLVGTSTEGPVFCADAIADPLAGLEATSAVVESLSRGGGELIEVSMAAVAATYAALPTEPATLPSSAPPPAAPPAAPPPAAPAAGLGADNDTVRRMVCERRRLSC
ncbi:MAG: CoA transferase, partial [Mycobacterium sp.]